MVCSHSFLPTLSKRDERVLIDFDYYKYGKAKYDNARKNIDLLHSRYRVPI